MKNLSELEMNIVFGAGIESDNSCIENYPIDLTLNDQNEVNQPASLDIDIEPILSETSTGLDVSISDPRCICIF